MHDQNGLFYEKGMGLWRSMSQDLNFNVMYSPRGIINLAHSDAQMNVYERRGNSMRLNGIDAVLLNREQVREIIPMADFSEKSAIGIISLTCSLFKRTASIPFNLIEFPLLE